jgi:hypothetical protein
MCHEQNANMKKKEIVKKARKLAELFRVTKGDKFRLKDVDPGDTLDFKSEDKPQAKEALAMGVEALVSYRTSSTRRTNGRYC